jgi:hypothetical protein
MALLPATILRPICWAKELYRTIEHETLVSGHEYIETQAYPQRLKCWICGKDSRGI